MLLGMESTFMQEGLVQNSSLDKWPHRALRDSCYSDHMVTVKHLVVKRLQNVASSVFFLYGVRLVVHITTVNSLNVV